MGYSEATASLNMIIESIALGSITLTYKPPQKPIEVGRPIVEIALIEPLPALETNELYKLPLEPIKPQEAPIPASSGLNGYEYPSCTGHVALKRYVPPGLGNATTWFARAQALGMATGSEPKAGAIGWTPGHVVYVESVNDDDTVTISENNYDYNGSTRTITVPATKYQYIY